MRYPGHSIRQEETDITLVKTIQAQLNKKGCGPIAVDGDFNICTAHAVMLFQTCFADKDGNPLKADGVIGPLTWNVLFDSHSIPVITEAPNALLNNVLDVARSQVGIIEEPAGSNNGAEVNKYQDAAGIEHGSWWSMAFIYWCFNKASKDLDIENPLFKTGNVLDEWCKTKGKKISTAEARKDVSLVKPGQVFIISTGGGFGHAGFIEKNDGGVLTTIEGNTYVPCNMDGKGVFRRTARKIDMVNIGFIEFE